MARRVYIAIPSYGAVAPQVAENWLSGQRALIDAGIDSEVGILPGCCHVDDARNMLVASFLATGRDRLIFLDADIVFDPQSLVRLAGIDRDVVGAAYRKKNDNEQYAVNPLKGEIRADAGGLIEVDSVGTGFLSISREVLEDLTALSPRFRSGEFPSHELAEVFHRAIGSDGYRVSGDVNFCHRARARGFRVFVDPELSLGHVGQKTWTGSYGSYLRRIHGLALARGIGKIRAGTFERTDVIALCEDWGNDNFAAGHELVAAAVEVAQKARGPIIEVGTGLTSLVMAATGAEVHALENDPVWFERTKEARDRLGLTNLHLHFAPLVPYPGGRWYSPVDGLPWRSCDVVLCDGPKRDYGKRAVLFDVMAEKGCYPRLLIQDDIEDPAETGYADYEFTVMGQIRRFAVGRRWKRDAA